MGLQRTCQEHLDQFSQERLQVCVRETHNTLHVTVFQQWTVHGNGVQTTEDEEKEIEKRNQNFSKTK
tara:strand:- start:115 stop:315 length:201 start_codon:yes stop_codon:yes gene_type:complete